MDCSTPGLPVHHQLPEFTQTHVHWVGDAIQSSPPLLSPSPPAFNLSQHQHLFQWMNWFFASGGQSIGASASTSVLPMESSPQTPLRPNAQWSGYSFLFFPPTLRQSSPFFNREPFLRLAIRFASLTDSESKEAPGQVCPLFLLLRQTWLGHPQQEHLSHALLSAAHKKVPKKQDISPVVVV